jgi:hypothetical protein
MAKFKIGDIITNGLDAGKVTEIVTSDRQWKTPGVRLMKIRTETFGGNVGMTEFVADYLSWRLAPLEWASITGGLQERWAWTADHAMLCREVRKAPELTKEERYDLILGPVVEEGA